MCIFDRAVLLYGLSCSMDMMCTYIRPKLSVHALFHRALSFVHSLSFLFHFPMHSHCPSNVLFMPPYAVFRG